MNTAGIVIDVGRELQQRSCVIRPCVIRPDEGKPIISCNIVHVPNNVCFHPTDVYHN